MAARYVRPLWFATGRRIARLLAALLPLCAAPSGWARAQSPTPVDLELVIAVDISRSIDMNEAELQRNGYIAAFRDPEVIRAIKAGVVGRIAVAYFEWGGAGNVFPVVGWTLIDGKDSAHAFADLLGSTAPNTAQSTSISGAIDHALPMFKGNGFEGTRRVIDVSGDGPNNSGDLVPNARDRAVAAGVTINGLPILDQSGGPYSRYNIPNLDLYYRDCVIGGPGAFLVVAQSFNDFARAIRRKLILEIAGRVAPPAGVWFAQAARKALASPPCDIGERLRRRDEW